MNTKYNQILLFTNTEDSAEEFYCIMLKKENRNAFRRQFQNCKKVIAFGKTDFDETKEVSVKSDTLCVTSGFLPPYVTIVYEKGGAAEQIKSDKIIVWQIFPAEDNIELERTVRLLQEKKACNPFLEIYVVLYSGNVRTGVTDLKSQTEALYQSERNCQKKYADCKVIACSSEEQFYEKKDAILFSSAGIDSTAFFNGPKQKLCEIETNLKNAMDYFSMYCNLPYDPISGVLSQEELTRITHNWEKVINSKNLMKTYFDIFMASPVYSALEVYLTDFYLENVKEICIWDMENDILNLKEELRAKLIAIQKNNSADPVQAPAKEIDYSSESKYSDLQRTFINLLNHFYEEDAKNVLFRHITDKITKYRRKMP